MSEEEKCLYQMSRFVDGFLDIGYDNIQRLCGIGNRRNKYYAGKC